MADHSATLTFTYDDVLLLALALEHWIASYRAIGQSLAPAQVGEIQQQIARAEAVLTRLNDARRNR